MGLEISDWRNVSYAETWGRQTTYFSTFVHARQVGGEYTNHIILCEHPHVHTLGRSGKGGNMLLSEEQLNAVGALLYHINQGGDAAYHGSGQFVCYPILNLKELSLGLKEYVYLLEEAVIRVYTSYRIAVDRVERAADVWLDRNLPRTHKICATDVRSNYYATMHGLALNVNTDLCYFSYINPCGFIDKGVTPLQKELGKEVSMEEVRKRLYNELKELL